MKDSLDSTLLTALRNEYVAAQPLQGARIGCAPKTPEVLREALRALGAEVQASLFLGKEPLNMLLDSGGEMTAQVLDACPEALLALKGLSEESALGMRHLQQRERRFGLPVPILNVYDSAVPAGWQHGLLDSFQDVQGKLAVVIGYGRFGKACCRALRQRGACVSVTEIDPICGYQAVLEGFSLVTLDQVAATGDLFVIATHCPHVLTEAHCKEMKAGALVLQEIDLPSSALAAQLLAQIELWQNHARYQPGIYLLPKHLDEKIARLHLTAIGARLSQITPAQANALGVLPGGPYKPDDYRY